MPTTEVDDFLAHYGVLGMHWGQRKAEEPVSAETQARRDSRAKKFKTRATSASTKINKLKTANETANGLTRAINTNKIKKLSKERDYNLKNAKLKTEGKLSDKQKKLLIAGSVAAGIILAAAAAKSIDSGDLRRAAIKGKEFLTKNKMEWKRDEFLARKDFGIDDIQAAVVKKINPDFGKFGANNNCRRATFAYELRRRGYDVAATKTAFGTGQASTGLFNATRPGEKYVSRNLLGIYGRAAKEGGLGKTPTPGTFGSFAAKGMMGYNKIPFSKANSIHENTEGIFNALNRMPNGARGELSVMWEGMPAGHSIAWEVVKNKVYLIDSQMNKVIKDANQFLDVYPMFPGSASYTRLDNANLNLDYLMRWVKDAT